MKIIAVIGSYRKDGMIDLLVSEILDAASDEGADVQRIYLVDQDIAFCTNCRLCTQSPEKARGQCRHADAMEPLLDELETADAYVLASPMNFGAVTAITKRFIERLVCYAYWPWGANIPRQRDKRKYRHAVVVATSAAPALFARYGTPIVNQLKSVAGLLNAKTVGVLFVGFAAKSAAPTPSPRARKKARKLGRKLASKYPH